MRDTGSRDDGRHRSVSGRKGRYEIRDCIGRGATSAVHLARSDTGGIVAAKHFVGSADIPRPETELIFRRERAALRGMEAHPLVPRYLDDAEQDGHWLIQEYVEGEPLSCLLDRVSRVPLDRALAWVCGIADVLAHMHALGFVYQDVKPENVVISRSGLPYLVDFGGVRLASDTESIYGTEGHTAPEIANDTGHVPGYQADVFSLGVLLYRMLSGNDLTQDDIAAAATANSRASFVDDCKLSPTMPPRVQRAVRQTLNTCVAPNPNLRYATLTQLITDIHGIATMVPRLRDRLRALDRLLQCVDGAVHVRTVSENEGQDSIIFEPSALDFGTLSRRDANASQAVSITCYSTTARTGRVTSAVGWLTVPRPYLHEGRNRVVVEVETAALPDVGAWNEAEIDIEFGDTRAALHCRAYLVPRRGQSLQPPGAAGTGALSDDAVRGDPHAVPADGPGLVSPADGPLMTADDDPSISGLLDRLSELWADPGGFFEQLMDCQGARGGLRLTGLTTALALATMSVSYLLSSLAPRLWPTPQIEPQMGADVAAELPSASVSGGHLTTVSILLGVPLGWRVLLWVWARAYQALCRVWAEPVSRADAYRVMGYASAPQLACLPLWCALAGAALAGRTPGTLAANAGDACVLLGTGGHLALLTFATTKVGKVSLRQAALVVAVSGGVAYLVLMAGLDMRLLKPAGMAFPGATPEQAPFEQLNEMERYSTMPGPGRARCFAIGPPALPGGPDAGRADVPRGEQAPNEPARAGSKTDLRVVRRPRAGSSSLPAVAKENGTCMVTMPEMHWACRLHG